MAHLAPVPGRLQVIARRELRRELPEVGASEAGESGGPTFTVLVDYAHTPAGLEVVLGEARRSRPAAGCSASSAAAATATGPSAR